MFPRNETILTWKWLNTDYTIALPSVFPLLSINGEMGGEKEASYKTKVSCSGHMAEWGLCNGATKPEAPFSFFLKVKLVVSRAGALHSFNTSHVVNAGLKMSILF